MSETIGARRDRPDPGRHVDIIARLQKRQELGREAERRLIEVILADLQFAANASIAQIAERANVSEPTFTRLARALGFPGTREMRFHLAQALAIGGAYLRKTDGEADAPSPLSEVVTKVSMGAHAALDLMCAGLGEVDIAAVVTPIVEAEQVLIYGTGGSSSMGAVELQNRLFRLGLQAVAYTDPQLQRMSASVLGRGALVIAFSISGQARSVIDAVLIARQYGATTISVTIPDTPLAAATDTVLPLTFREDGDLYKPTSTRYALLAAVDIIAMGTAKAIGPGVLEQLRRVRQSLASQNIRDPNLPIGD